MSLHIGTSKFTELSSASTPSINSFFSKAAKAQDENYEKGATLVRNDTMEKFSNQPGLDKEKRTGKVVKETGIGAFFLSRTATSKKVSSMVEKDASSQNSARGSDKPAAASLSPPKAGIAHYLEQKESARFGNVHQPLTTSCNPYKGCQIDQDILQSLPEEIQREIKRSFGNHCESEDHQDTEGIRQFAVVAHVGAGENNIGNDSGCIQGTAKTDVKSSCLSGSNMKRNYSDLNVLTISSSKEREVKGVSHSCNKTSDESNDTDKVKCEKCGEDISAWEMPVHLDYHFAKELEQADYSNLVSVELNRQDSGKPPKKKKRTSCNIESFFSQK